MKKLVIEIDLEAINGRAIDVVEILAEMATSCAGYPFQDLREPTVEGLMSTRMLHKDRPEPIKANVVASLDVVEGSMSFNDINTREYHCREEG